MKRKTIALVFVFLQLMLVYAAEYKLDPTDLTIEISDKYLIKREKNPLTDKFMEGYLSGPDSKYTVEDYRVVDPQITFVAKSSNLVLTLTVLYDKSFKDNLYPSASEIATQKNNMKETAEFLGAELLESGTRTTGFATYFYQEMIIPDWGNLGNIVYSVTINNFYLTFTFASKDGFSSEEKAEVERIMSSVKRVKYSSSNNKKITVPEKSFTDPVSGISFPVPAGYQEFSSPDVFCAYHNYDTMESIEFASYDIYAEYPAAMRKYISRKDIDSSITTSSEMATLFGVSKFDVSERTIGGVRYYAAKIKKNNSNGVKIITHQYVTINNGYMLVFEYYNKNNPLETQKFETFLKTIRY